MSKLPMIERPSIYKRWGKVDSNLALHAELTPRFYDDLRKLQQFSLTGILEGLHPITNEPLDRPYTADFLFRHTLGSVAYLWLMEGETESVKSRHLSSTLKQAVPYFYTSRLCDLKSHFVFDKKFPNRKLRQFSLERSCAAAFAFGLGLREAGKKIAEICLVALRQDYCFDVAKYPIFHFILRLYCNWQDKDYPLQDFPTHPIMEGLLAEWRTNDIERIEGWLLAACDHHTHRARPDNNREFFEFSNGWRFYPIEILMVLRLRQYLGLPNPELDHPIMKFPWSVLSPEMSLEPDELLQAVLKRAKEDEDFDPELLYQELMVG